MTQRRLRDDRLSDIAWSTMNLYPSWTTREEPGSCSVGPTKQTGEWLKGKEVVMERGPLEYIALGLILFVALFLFYAIIFIHDIPYKIAKRRNHPHQEAIHYGGCQLRAHWNRRFGK